MSGQKRQNFSSHEEKDYDYLEVLGDGPKVDQGGHSPSFLQIRLSVTACYA